MERCEASERQGPLTGAQQAVPRSLYFIFPAFGSHTYDFKQRVVGLDGHLWEILWSLSYGGIPDGTNKNVGSQVQPPGQ